MSRGGGFHEIVLRAARKQAEILLGPDAAPNPKDTVHHAVVLIDDLVHRLDETALAVEFALQFHHKVEIWRDWTGWREALHTLLIFDHRDPTISIRLQIFMSSAARGVREYDDAEYYAKLAYEKSIHIENTPLIAKSLNQLAAFALEKDDFEQARIYLDNAFSYDISQISHRDLGNIYIKSGDIAVQQDRFIDAHEYFDKAIHHFGHVHDNLFVTMVYANQADLLRREGKLDQAIIILQNTLHLFQQEGAKYDYAIALNSLGYIHLQAERWNDADRSFTEAVEVLSNLGALAAKARVLTNLVELYVKEHRYPLAESIATEAYALAKICNKPIITAFVHDDYGLMLFERGEYEISRQLWLESLAIKEALGAESHARYTRELLQKITNLRQS